MGNLLEKSEGPVSIEGRKVCLLTYNVKHTYKAYTIHMNMITTITFIYLDTVSWPYCTSKKLVVCYLRCTYKGSKWFYSNVFYRAMLFVEAFSHLLPKQLRSGHLLTHGSGNCHSLKRPLRLVPRSALVFVLFKVFTVPSICLVLELVLPLYLTLGTLGFELKTT